MKIKITASLALVVAFLLAGFASSAQNIEKNLTIYADKYQPERISLHFDKASYTAGETIWFKIYLMSDIYPVNESKSVYTDFIDDNGNVLAHNIGPVVDGVSSGQLDIPADYTSRYVHVRSYTKWMLNFDTAFIYKKDIRVIGKESKTSVAAKLVPQYDLQFFPEGGDAIAGIPNKIAFKASNQWGLPFAVKGTILANGQAVQNFASVHDGMGYITLTPDAGVSYQAKWKDEKNVEHTTALPAAKSSGVSLQMFFKNGRHGFALTRTANVAPEYLNLHLIGTIHGHTVFKADPSLVTKTAVQAMLPSEQFPSGVLTVTLFDEKWNAIAERIVFVQNNDYIFQPSVTVQHYGLNKRARNEIEIKLPDSVLANMSVAITDAAIDADSSNTIISQLMLSSELRGSINNPAFYFRNNSDTLANYLDLVMLTNGWRRFKWEEVAAGKMPVITYPRDTNYLYLSGKIFGIPAARLSPADNIILMTKEKDSSTKMMILPIANDGSFGDPNLVLFDSLRIYYQIKSKLAERGEAKFMTSLVTAPNYTKQIRSLQLYNPYMDTAGNYRHRYLAEEQARAIALLQGKTLSMVTVTAKTKSPIQALDEKYAKGLFAGGDATQFDLVNDPFAAGRPDVFSYLQGKVAGLMISGNGSNTSLQWRGGSPALYLDEMPVDVDMISTIPVSDIAYVKVFRPPFMGGSGGGNGAIAIYTRKGGDMQSAPGKGLSRNVVTGYTPIRQFYSPNYSSFDKRNEQADLRSTLYWNPVVVTTDKKHSSTIVFYNNDVTKAFRIIIEGMSKDGLLTHYEEVIE